MGWTGHSLARTLFGLALLWHGHGLALGSPCQGLAQPCTGPFMGWPALNWSGHRLERPWARPAMGSPGHGLALPWSDSALSWPGRGLAICWSGHLFQIGPAGHELAM